MARKRGLKGHWAPTQNGIPSTSSHQRQGARRQLNEISNGLSDQLRRPQNVIFEPIGSIRKPPKFWLNAIEAKYEGKGTPYTRSDFEVGLGKYAALSDQPCYWLWRELMDAYPEAKVILVQRDFQRWIKSYDQASVTGVAFTPMTDVVVLLEPLLNSYVARAVRKVILGYFHARNAQEVLANAKGVFERHYDEIREKCAKTPGRLVEMRIDQGWEPIFPTHNMAPHIMVMQIRPRLERCDHFWKLPLEVRQKIFSMAFNGQILLMKTPLRRASEIQGVIYRKRVPRAFNNLLVSKKFYAEATKVLFETATFAFVNVVEDTGRMRFNGEVIWAPMPDLTLVTSPGQLQRIRSFEVLHGLELQYLVAQAVRFEMILHYIVLARCNPSDFGFGPLQDIIMQTDIARDCSHLCDLQTLRGPDNITGDLAKVKGLRNVEVRQQVCDKCRSEARFCKCKLIQLELEMAVLREILKAAEEEKDGGRIRALEQNIGERQRLWTDGSGNIAKWKAKQVKAEAKD
ncbi:hypothetical protein M409DRAFT_20859 [Zasmidium cellare ATCC 36951]|uniref:Sulfotransferase domain-containing protein n=1 Tax=Zasmidium cellare ATCC 36951 TaxID=1080233 RepID=A0A6A6CNY4_ZASCE|nr:uncharacterized protein M409DRAFT_20859 [Zasmidium cellare ATCC 36951]KAF2168844.1 hypothetical protein M409DRAFT_20859 [Zasmidium cellare ATCC 36951]